MRNVSSWSKLTSWSICLWRLILIESELKSNLIEFEGSDYIKEFVHKVFKDKEIKLYKDSERADGQEGLVANEPWYVYSANFGTIEEKSFVKLFSVILYNGKWHLRLLLRKNKNYPKYG